MPMSRPASAFRAYLSYFKGEERLVALSLALILAQTLSIIPIAALLQRVLDRSIPAQDPEELALLLAATFVLFLVNAAALIGNRYLTLGIVKRAIRALRAGLVKSALSRSHASYALADIDTLHSRTVHDTERVDCMTSALLAQFLPAILIVCGLSVFLVILNPILFAALALVLPIAYVIGRKIGGTVRTRTKEFHDDFASFSKGTLFVLAFSHLIKVSAAEEHEYRTQEAVIERLRASSQRMAWLGTVHTALQSNTLVLAGVLVLFVGGMQVIEGAASLGGLLSFYVALNLLSANARNAVGAIPVMIEGYESLRAVMPLVDDRETEDSGARFGGLEGEIRFDHVGFRHDDRFALVDVTFRVRKGEMVGLYGSSGSGKSTVANLLLGLYAPDAGAILIDGTDVRSLNSASYRSRIGVLSQNPALFPGTIRENLAYGLPEVSDEDMRIACSHARIHEHILGLAEGYDTEIGDRGARLSGGQRQRVALARALLRKPDLLVLDEPDNHLDSELTRGILAAVRSLGITALVITHDAPLRSCFDRVYEFRDVSGGMTLVETKP